MLRRHTPAFRALCGIASSDSHRALLLKHGALQLILTLLRQHVANLSASSSASSSFDNDSDQAETLLWALKALTHLAFASGSCSIELFPFSPLVVFLSFLACLLEVWCAS